MVNNKQAFELIRAEALAEGGHTCLNKIQIQKKILTLHRSAVLLSLPTAFLPRTVFILEWSGWSPKQDTFFYPITIIGEFTDRLYHRKRVSVGMLLKEPYVLVKCLRAAIILYVSPRLHFLPPAWYLLRPSCMEGLTSCRFSWGFRSSRCKSSYTFSLLEVSFRSLITKLSF